MPETLGSFQARLAKTPIGTGVDPEVLLGLINDRIERICRARPWTRLEKQGIIQTAAEYTDGTVDIAVGATSGTGTGTTFTSAMTGELIRVATLLEFYTFTFVSTTAFTIDRAYEATDDADDASFRIWQPIYELPSDCETIHSIRNPTNAIDLEEQAREWLDRNGAARYAYGPPYLYVPAEDSSDGVARVELYPGPTESVGLPIRYLAKPPLFTVPANTSEEFPDWMSVPCIYSGVLADLYRQHDEQQRSQSEERHYETLFAEMVGEDARRRPPMSMMPADRYTIHRQVRAERRYGRVRNWSGTE